MTTLTDIVQDLAAIAKRGAITEDELKRLLGYVVQEKPASEQVADGNKSVAIPTSVLATQPHMPRKRHYVSRGEYGWVNSERAQGLNLVALLELGGRAERPKRLDYIRQRWSKHFSQADLAILPIAREPRWQKTCEWAVYPLVRDGLAERPRRGVLTLTANGRREAESAKGRLT